MAAAQVLAAVDSPRRVDRRPGRLAAPSGPTPRGEWTPRAATRPGEWTPCSVESPLETLPLATPARSTRPLQRSTRPLRAVHSTSASGPLDLHERSTGPARAVDSSRRARESPRVASVARASARPIEGERSVRLSVCVRVPYPKAVPIGTSIVKRRTHESVWMQTRCWLAG